MSSTNWAGSCPKDAEPGGPLPRGCSQSLPGLGDFRTTLERVRPAPGVALLRLASLLGERLQGFFRQPYLQQVPGRHRVITADLLDVGLQPDPLFGNLVTARGGPADY